MSARDALVLVAYLAALAGGVSLAGHPAVRGLLGPEARRKGVHVAMGVLAASAPWLLHAPDAVPALGAAALLFLLGVRALGPLRRRLGWILAAPGRRGVGDVAFAVALPATFLASGGDGPRYAAAMLLLAVGDAAAALAGDRSGVARYRRWGRGKSPRGTAAFVAWGGAAATLALLATGGPLTESLLVRGIAATLAAAAVERVTTLGLDNLLVPVAGAALLADAMPLEAVALAGLMAAVLLSIGLRRAAPTDPIRALRRGDRAGRAAA